MARSRLTDESESGLGCGGAIVLLSVIRRRAAEVRALLDLGAFADATVPLRHGGAIPAELFARVAFNDLARLSSLHPSADGEVDGAAWQRLVEDIDLLHAVALVRTSASAGRGPSGRIDVGPLAPVVCDRHLAGGKIEVRA